MQDTHFLGYNKLPVITALVVLKTTDHLIAKRRTALTVSAHREISTARRLVNQEIGGGSDSRLGLRYVDDSTTHAANEYHASLGLALHQVASNCGGE